MRIAGRIKKRDLLLFAVPILFYFINNQIKYQVELPYLGYLLRNHFNDFLGGVSILAYINMVFALKKKPPYRLTRFWQILTAALGAGLFWELITPLYKPDSTGDLWDIAAYILGGAVYFGLDKVIGYKSAKS